MPELPEVETIVRGLGPLVRGRRIEGVWWSGQGLHLGRKVDLRGLRAVAVGRAIAGVRRRGKYILVDVDGRGAGGRRGDHHSPWHDRAPARSAEGGAAGAPHARGAGARRRGRAPLRRRAPLRLGDAGTADRGGRRARRARPRSAHRARRGRAGHCARRRPDADQGVLARPAPHRRPGKHLRRRGAVSGRRSSQRRRPSGSPAGPTSCWRRCAPRWRAGSPGGAPPCATTSTSTANAATTRPRCWSTGARGSPCLRCGAADSPTRRQRAGDLLLRALPAALSAALRTRKSVDGARERVERGA